MNFLNSVVRKVSQTINLGVNITQKTSLDLPSVVSRLSNLAIQGRGMATLNQMHRTGPHIKPRIPKRPLDGNPFMKGVVLKTLIKKPKKPNSANRKCVLVRLSNGKEMVAYIPGIGHNLQEHNIVLCRVGRVQDCPGVKLKCVRGKYDLGHVIVNRK
ncbi:unnamed protein product [Acanthoscelides obtectus]|uniref:Small ribosomal subunit protein uS12m n=1 Tax=Acanthoscelides obtectus TaxID=200917 RepID=A0A9P0QA57_ACAOB|nr:unnamed protein product [Acanthoscelides obtectus]CAK1643251.1 40S ribosomal protein S12, mitochondrial [Acanthoscelides obtectus]